MDDVLLCQWQWFGVLTHHGPGALEAAECSLPSVSAR
jgi:hypothetical protein